MEKIGVYVCNYNKKEYVIKCVESLLNQTIKNVDIYVVDNASEDGSVEALEERFGKKISVIKNNQNLGGSGGFNTGLQDALEKDYKYVVLVDNDVWVDKDALQIMYDYMQRQEDVGILGPTILRMDMPEIVQDLGGKINKRYNMQGNYTGKKAFKLPDELECTYLSTCTAMARVEAVRKFGLMPTDNFIYWDDVEWSKKCQLHGYRTVAISAAKVWHNHSITSQSKTSFTRYYLTRNRLHFFAKYAEEKIESFSEILLSEVFAQLYGYYNKGMTELFQTTVYALDDFLHGVRGKADDFKIIRISETSTPFERAVSGKERIKITFIDNFCSDDPLEVYHIFLYLVTHIQKQWPQKTIWVSLKECGYQKPDFERLLKKVIEMDRPDFVLPEFRISDVEDGGFDLELRLCEHVNLVKQPVFPQIYVDKYCNCITSEEEYEYFKSYSANEKLFKEIYRPLFMQAVRNIRNDEKKGEQVTSYEYSENVFS